MCVFMYTPVELKNTLLKRFLQIIGKIEKHT